MEKTQRTKDMERLWKALHLCYNLHEDQVDKCGQPYWIHPFTVAMRGFTGYSSNEISNAIVGLLHDVPEDTEMSVDALATLIELNGEEIEALRLLTRKKEVAYDEYIDRIITSENKIAMCVKLDDLLHNHNLNRFIEAGVEVTEKDEQRSGKYLKAFEKLYAKIQDI